MLFGLFVCSGAKNLFYLKLWHSPAHRLTSVKTKWIVVMLIVYDRKAFFHFGRKRNWPEKPIFFLTETNTKTEKNFQFWLKLKTETEIGVLY